MCIQLKYFKSQVVKQSLDRSEYLDVPTLDLATVARSIWICACLSVPDAVALDAQARDLVRHI